MNNLAQLLPEDIPIRDRVSFAESIMKKLPQRELKVEHHFSFGVYARVLYIPADTILTGKIHKYPQINLLRQGCLSVLVGAEIKKLKAPDVIVSPAGTKRIAQVHSDTVWVTIHGTHLKDVDAIENYFIAQSERDYLEFRNETLLGQPGRFH